MRTAWVQSGCCEDQSMAQYHRVNNGQYLRRDTVQIGPKVFLSTNGGTRCVTQYEHEWTGAVSRSMQRMCNAIDAGAMQDRLVRDG